MLIFLVILTIIAFICCCVSMSGVNILFLFVMGFILFLYGWKTKKDAEENERLSNLVKNNINRIIENNKLKISKIYEIYNPMYLTNNIARYQQTLQVDENQRKILFTNGMINKFIVVNFEDILNYEIYEDGSKSSTTYDWGYGLKTSDFSDNCNELKLIIRLKNYEDSQFVFNLIYASFPKNSPAYKSIRSSLQDCVSFLEILKSENQEINKKVFKNCEFCGTKIDINENKCSNCGASLKK